MKFVDTKIIACDLLFLSQNDPIFASYNIDINDIPWTVFDSGYSGLVRILQGQQISYKGAETMWRGLESTAFSLGYDTVSIAFMESLNEDALKSFGFSRQKQKYLKALNRNISNDIFDFETLKHACDADVIAEITKLKGFGMWSAQMYLILCLQRKNVMPARDLVVDRAVMQVFDLDMRPFYAHVISLTNRWDGRLTAATLLLWYLQVFRFSR